MPHDAVRYYFPALAEGLAEFFGRGIRVAVGFELQTPPSGPYIYDPHHLFQDRFPQDLVRGTLPTAARASALPRSPEGHVIAVRSNASLSKGFDDLVVLVEVPHWSVSSDPIEHWALYFLHLVQGKQTDVSEYSTLRGFARFAIQDTARHIFHGGSGSLMVRGRLPVTASYLTRVCKVAGRREEGHLPTGSFICADEQEFAPQGALERRLRPPVSLDRSKLLRKVLQMGGDQTAVACTAEEAIGFSSDQQPPAKYVRISIHDGVAAISVKGEGALNEEPIPIGFYGSGGFHGIPNRPNSSIISEDLMEYANLLGIALPQNTADGVAKLACLAAGEGHGAMFVIGEDLSRLYSQGQEFDSPLNVVADQARLLPMSTVDGAVLVHLTGEVHAVAALVDGVAVQNYDPSRGARHNSAIRYTAHSTAIILAVSEDGPYAVFGGGRELSVPPHVEHPAGYTYGVGPLPLLTRYNRDLTSGQYLSHYWESGYP